MKRHRSLCLIMLCLVSGCTTLIEAPSTTLPMEDGNALIPAQDWEWQDESRTVRAYVRYPEGTRAAVTSDTGLMLTLHNWGGTDHRGAPDPRYLADRYNVVAISVDYLQSGKYNPETDPPYDIGYLQATDALRALYWVWNGLERDGIAFAKDRIYTTGGSGGGNVSLMANKLAPRTFAAVIDCSGMAKLSDDIAFGLEGGSYLNAGYSRDPESPRYLSPDRQALLFVGEPNHLQQMRDMGAAAKILVVHGADDHICPIEDVREMIANFQAAGLDVNPHIIGKDDLDGKVFKDTGHSIGNRTLFVRAFADNYLHPHSPALRRRAGKADFERPEEPVRYDTENGHYLVDYAQGYPVIHFMPKP